MPIDATLCHAADPPVTLGSVGAVRSIRTVLDPLDDEGAQADALPSESTPRNCTSVWPSAVTVMPEAVAGAVHVPPGARRGAPLVVIEAALRIGRAARRDGDRRDALPGIRPARDRRCGGSGAVDPHRACRIRRGGRPGRGVPRGVEAAELD